MKTDFIITSIKRVVMVSPTEYTERISKFANILEANELIFHFSGNSKVYFDDKILETKANMIRFLPKGNFKQYIVEREIRGMCIFAVFSTDKPISNNAFVLSVESNVIIPSLFKRLFSRWVSKREGYYFECISILYKIFAEMQKNNYIPEQKYSQIKPAIDYIQDNFTSHSPSSEELVHMCGISYSYIRKLFMQKFGMSPKTYLLNLKMNYSGDLLLSGLYNTTQVAELCGYDNISLFHRQFKNYYNLTPTEYIKKYKSKK